MQKDPDGDKDNGPDPNNSDNGDDEGQGHQFVINIGAHTYLYTLNRATGHIDSDQLVIHELTPTPADPLNGAPPQDDVSTDTTVQPAPATGHQTTGVLNPDGILGVVPEAWPLTIIYGQKILNGDNTGTTAFSNPLQVCNNNSG